jgi:heme/copper-type cytochrome/quinol oxidase subunit 4
LFNPLVSRHESTGQMTSPSPLTYALGFGLPLLFCVAGLAVGREQLTKRCWPVMLWFVLSVALAYLPFWFQRKLIFGAHIPLCIVAAISLDLFLNRLSNPRTRGWITAIAAVVFLPLLVSTPAYLLASENREARNNAGGCYYISSDVMDGLQFLKSRTKPGDVVFARVETSRLIPGIAGNTVVWGHWAQSVDLAERQNWITSLFNAHADWTDPARAREFWGTNIQYIFADGEFKQSLEQGRYRWQVILNDADEVFTNRSVVIYKHRGR